VVRAVAAEDRWILTEPPVDALERAATIRAGLHRGEAFWVLERDGEIVGGLGLHPAPDRGTALLGMAVRADARGRGGGGALLDAALAHAEARGIVLELEVFDDNEPAIALYRSRGFDVVETLPGRYPRRDGTTRSGLRMTR
jgi:ribosomal protein S18 acetylase RimI-like enzyme